MACDAGRLTACRACCCLGVCALAAVSADPDVVADPCEGPGCNLPPAAACCLATPSHRLPAGCCSAGRAASRRTCSNVCLLYCMTPAIDAGAAGGAVASRAFEATSNRVARRRCGRCTAIAVWTGCAANRYTGACSLVWCERWLNGHGSTARTADRICRHFADTRNFQLSSFPVHSTYVCRVCVQAALLPASADTERANRTLRHHTRQPTVIIQDV